MSVTKDRQGYLEDLSQMTLPQLKELLDRQERILSKKKFLASLPDKGEKSQVFADKLKKLIEERRAKESPVQKLCQVISHGSLKQQERSQGYSEDREESMLGSLVSRNEEHTTYSLEKSEERSTKKDISSSIGNDADDLLQQMNELSFGTKLPDKEDSHVNSYERVIRKAELDPRTTPNKFVPNRPRSDKESRLPTPPWTKPPTKSPKVKEESAVRPPAYSHQSTKLISIEESVQLVREQKQRTELLAAERAAQRLADQLSTPTIMNTYQPANMSYRQPASVDNDGNNDDQDSDDFPSDDDDGL